jgi:outer membrane protein assembly factor BamD (BamD/ComL family)
VHHRSRIFLVSVLFFLLLPLLALAQKPSPTPAPPPAASAPGGSGSTFPTGTQPVQPDVDLVMFLHGHVATNDSTAIPHDVSVAVVCNGKVRQQVYATLTGDFSMQLGTRTGAFLDASDDPSSQQVVPTKPSLDGVDPRDLAKCELRTSASGFLTNNISLMGLTPDTRTADVGNIVIERLNKVTGNTISAVPYKTTETARKAYEKGLAAQRSDKLDDARKYFEQAVNLNPHYAGAWFRLGTVLQKQNENDSARAAYTKATNIDTRFLPPYLSLTSMAYAAKDWSGVLLYSSHVISVDPLNYGEGNTFVVDLDEFNPGDAYFYNAVANYKLDHFQDAEKSALKAERVSLRDHAPQVHLLLADLFTRKQDYSRAVAELQTYLQLVPHAQDSDLIRAQIAKLDQLAHSTPVTPAAENLPRH